MGYNEYTYRDARTTEIVSHVQDDSQQAASELQRIIEGIDGVLAAIAANTAAVEGSVAACTAVMKEIVAQVPSLLVLGVTSATGKLKCDSLDLPPDLDLSDRPYIQRARLSLHTELGGFTRSRSGRGNVLPIARPIVSSGAVTGFVFASLNLDWLYQRMKARGLSQGGTLTVADRDGTILVRVPENDRFVGTRFNRAVQGLLHANAPGNTRLVGVDGVERILGYIPIDPESRSLYVGAGIAVDEAFAAIDRATVANATLIAIGAALAALAAWMVGDVIVQRPVARIVDTVRAWRDGDISARTGLRGTGGGLNLIGDSLDHFLEELDRRETARVAAEDQQRLLTNELVHRIKNTLAIVGAIARQTFSSGAEPLRLKSFSERLAALAGAYDVVLAKATAQADVRSAVEQALRPFQSPDGAHCRLQGPTATMQPQAVLALTLVLHELATNASKYGALTRDAGRVDLTWSVDAAQRRIVFVWRESEGPSVEKPKSQGFGSKLIARAFAPALHPVVDLDYAPTGVVCTIALDLPEHVAEAA